MKTLVLALLLVLVSFSAHAQTPIVEKNIRDCFKHSPKRASDFDWCVAEEFRRVREEKRYRELRIRAGKDPDGGCAKDLLSTECFEERANDRARLMERLAGETPSYPYATLIQSPHYRFFYYPYRYVPRYLPVGRTYRHWTH